MALLSLRPADKDNKGECRMFTTSCAGSYSTIPGHQPSTSRAPMLALGSFDTLTLKHSNRKSIKGNVCSKTNDRTIKLYSNISDHQTSTLRGSLPVSFQSLNLKQNQNKMNNQGCINKNSSFSDNTRGSCSNIHNQHASRSKSPISAAASTQTSSQTLKIMPQESTLKKCVTFKPSSQENVGDTKVNGPISNKEEINMTHKRRGFKGFPVIKSSDIVRAGSKRGLCGDKYTFQNEPNSCTSSSSIKLSFLLNSNSSDDRPLNQRHIMHMSRSNSTAMFRDRTSAFTPDNVISDFSSARGRDCTFSRKLYTRKWIWINNEKIAAKDDKRVAKIITSRYLADVYKIGVPETGCIKLVGIPPDLGETLPVTDRKKMLTQRSQQCEPAGGFFKSAVSQHSQPSILIRNKTVLRLINSVEKEFVPDLETTLKGEVTGVSKFSTTFGELLHSKIPKALSQDIEVQKLAGVLGSRDCAFAYQFNRNPESCFKQQYHPISD